MNDTLDKYDPEIFFQNMQKVMLASGEISQDIFNKNLNHDGAMSATSNSMMQACLSAVEKMVENPDAWMKSQADYWESYMNLVSNTAARFFGENIDPLYVPSERDKRFKDVAWQENILFDFLKQSYLMTSHWLQTTMHDGAMSDRSVQRKVDFVTRQFVDALSPSNFAMTNPEVLRHTLENNGENLVKGIESFGEDLKKSGDIFKISSTDSKLFEIGKNIATTPGKIVFQNDLVQLIQYSPSTDEVYKTPLFIISPWINKYYVLDLKPENSFVKWLVDQGHTVFITSWVNPDDSLRDKKFEDYMQEGILDTLDAIKKATGEDKINVIGYCIGGTLLAAALAYMKAKGLDNPIKSTTYFTTLLDFADSGELGIFVDEMQLADLEERMQESGYLDGNEMAIIFSSLRANEMVWSFVVNNYLLGRSPFPFDLLYWNADSTRMPAAMHSFYLRNMYLHNNLVNPGGVSMKNVPIDLTVIDTPSYMISTIEDHIAPWKSTFKALDIFKGPMRFVLAGSGHIAGVVNHPAKKKYGYWTNENDVKDADKWLEQAEKHEGSWWMNWQKWLEDGGFVGDKVSARIPGDGALEPIEDAPGSYVMVR